jgi:bifunctional non-homologous end joining protein LigD
MSTVAERPKSVRKWESISESGDLKIEGKKVPVSHLDKVFYPKVGFTKAQVIDYYTRIAPVLQPHLKDRPVTMKRYPNGVEAPFFYEKRCPTHRPAWVNTARVWSKNNKADINFCVINDLPSLVWVANLGNLELHTSLARCPNMDRPTMIVFDLDPGAPANIVQCSEVAVWIRKAMEKLGLETFVKTSGSKGLQVYIPLNTPTHYDETREFAKKLAEMLEDQNPKLVTANMSRSGRKGKVLVDWSQNHAHKTTVCVYSLRAKEQPTVSTPVSWREMETALKKQDAQLLSFVAEEVLKRVDKKGDLFAPVLKLKQKVPSF